jgi:hypothetical protein
MDAKEQKRLYDIEYRKKNKEKRKQQNDSFYKTKRSVRFTENPRYYLWYIAKVRAKQKKTEFSIYESDIVIPKICPIIGMKLVKGNGYLPNAMSLDRVDNTKGYVKGNVRVISRKANILKSNMDIQTLEKIIKYIKNEI